jgi:uncharacterized protein YggU (UPF0235/DUF167 family)
VTGSPPWRAHSEGLDIAVRLTPRGGHDVIEGVETLSDGRAVLKARVRAAPEKGAANAALEALIAKAFGVPKTAVAVVAGASGRLKSVRVEGEPESLVRALAVLAKT